MVQIFKVIHGLELTEKELSVSRIVIEHNDMKYEITAYKDGFVLRSIDGRLILRPEAGNSMKIATEQFST